MRSIGTLSTPFSRLFMCVVTEQQRAATDAADVGYVYHGIYELAYPCAKKRLEAER